MIQVVAAFSGTGKTTMAQTHPDIVAVDSSAFTQDPQWPDNYIRFILKTIRDEGKCIFVSTHDVIREGLSRLGIPYLLVYPTPDCKAEYIKRCVNRGCELRYVDHLEHHFDEWVNQCPAQEGCVHVMLKPGQYLADVIDYDSDNQEFTVKRSPDTVGV